MTDIVNLRDVGDAGKPEGDAFASGDLNKIYQAMLYVLRVLTTTQTTIRPDRIYIGDQEAGYYRDADGNMVIFDPVAGAFKLSQLGGSAFAHGPWLGDAMPCPDAAAPVVNRLYLRFAEAQRDEVVTGVAVGPQYGTPGSYDNAKAAVYDTAGNLLRGGTSVSVDAPIGNKVLPLISPLALDPGYYWLAAIFQSNTGLAIYGKTAGGHNAKYIDVGSYTFPDPAAIAGASWAAAWVPGMLGAVTGGLTFEGE